MSENSNVDGNGFPTADEIAAKLDRLREVDQPRYRRLWAYFRNPMRIVGRGDGDRDRPYRQAQEWGLPSRITGVACGSDVLSGVPLDEVARKEVVIENDIGWRMDAMVILLADYGKPSKPKKRRKQRRQMKPKPYLLKPLPPSVPHSGQRSGMAR